MKFCDNLQRLVDISDPSWAPFWINYKLLKKLVKELPPLVPTDGTKNKSFHITDQFEDSSSPSNIILVNTSNQKVQDDRISQFNNEVGERASLSRKTPEHTLQKMLENDVAFQTREEVVRNLSISKTALSTPNKEGVTTPDLVKTMGKDPKEVGFFKLLHCEVKKCVYFFSKTEQEFLIHEERIREGVEIMRNCARAMSSDRWSNATTSLYRLYKDLLLLETYAVMSYCSFSKILKKHDKVTGHNTRKAFMSNVVAKTNFSNYPNLLQMISRCEALYEKISQLLLQEGKECLKGDGYLFMYKISCMNGQVLDVDNEEDVIASSILRSGSNSCLSPIQAKVTSFSRA